MQGMQHHVDVGLEVHALEAIADGVVAGLGRIELHRIAAGRRDHQGRRVEPRERGREHERRLVGDLEALAVREIDGALRERAVLERGELRGACLRDVVAGVPGDAHEGVGQRAEPRFARRPVAKELPVRLHARRALREIGLYVGRGLALHVDGPLEAARGPGIGRQLVRAERGSDHRAGDGERVDGSTRGGRRIDGGRRGVGRGLARSLLVRASREHERREEGRREGKKRGAAHPPSEAAWTATSSERVGERPSARTRIALTRSAALT